MDDAATAFQARRDAIIAEFGPWVAYNIDLGHGVHTIEPGQVGTPEFLIHAFAQVVADLARKPLDQLRILDLGCHEGGYAIELARHGATVVGIEGRRQHVEKARFAAEVLGLDRATFVEDDVRNVSAGELGRFDVVLCLGILYHLGPQDAVRLLERCYECCEQFTVIRSAIGLSANAKTRVGPYTYGGRRYKEDHARPGAALKNPVSILPSRVSLLNLLADVGFTSVLEICNPFVPAFESVRDSLSLVALRGAHLPYRSVTGIDDVVSAVRRSERRGPAWLWQGAHPQQGLFWRARERVTHSFARAVFTSRRPISEWQKDPPRPD
jgi:SAM-dependent methyltransferase